MRVFKIKIEEFGNKEMDVVADCKHDRYGFTHKVTGLIGCQEFNGKARWVNRTYECYTYQTALHDLCDRVAAWKHRVPSVRALYKAKKWVEAKKMADRMKEDFDKAYKGSW